jgi:hypothetical protein
VNGIDDPSGGVFDGAPDGWDADDDNHLLDATENEPAEVG